MADPFSVTGSAVGVVSMSIQVCERLVWYINNVKDANDKAENLLAQTERLGGILGDLKTCVDDLSLVQPTIAIRNVIAACNDAINTFREKLEDCSPLSGSKPLPGAVKLAKRIVFPFKQSDLFYLRDAIDCIVQALQLALQALQLEHQRVAFENLTMQITQAVYTNRTTSQLIIDEIRANQLLPIFRNTACGQSTQSGSTSINENTEAVPHAAPSNLLHLNLLQQVMTALSRIESRLNTASVNQSGHYTKTRSGSLQLQRSQKNVVRSHFMDCTCRGQLTTDMYSQWPIVYTQTRRSLHDESCPDADHDIGSTDAYLGLHVGSLMLGFGANLSLSLVYGAGSFFSLRPSLICYRVVSESSPAFSAIKEITGSWHIDPLRKPRHEWETATKYIIQMFHTRIASPHDRLENGMTLLHYLCSRLRCGRYDQELHSRIMFQSLLQICSSEALEKDNRGYTCVDYLLHDGRAMNHPGQTPLVVELLDNGLQISPKAHINQDDDFLLLWSLNEYTKFPDPFTDSSDGIDKILSKSICGIQEVIENDRTADILSTEDILSWHKLAISIGWEEGCKTLLESGLRITPRHPNEYDGSTLLENAIDSPNLCIVKMLLEARVGMQEDEIECIGHPEIAFQISSGCDWLFQISLDLAGLFLASTVDQRRQLQSLAMTHLDGYACWHNNGSLPDAHVECILHALAQKGIKVQPWLKPARKSIYHWPAWSSFPKPKVLDMAYEAGFRDFRAANFICANQVSISPLMFMITEFKWAGLAYMMDLIQWFLSKGASLDEQWPNSDTTAVHCLGWALGCLTSTHTHDASLKASGVMLHIADDHLDKCTCACSSSGCAFIHTFWKALQHHHLITDNMPEWVSNWPVRSELARLDAFTWCIKKATALEGRRWIISEFIRLYIFSELGLRHTCCDLQRLEHDGEPDLGISPTPRYPPKQTERIKREDAYLIGVLEEMVVDLDARYDPFEKDIDVFVTEVMSPAVEATLARLRVEDEAMYTAGRRNMGVVMFPVPHDERDDVEDIAPEIEEPSPTESEDESVW